MRVRNLVAFAPGVVATAIAPATDSATCASLPRGSRQHRFGILGVTIALLVAAGVGLAIYALRVGNSGQQPHSVTTPRLFAPEPPYVGVACRYSNSTRCGRIGIAVWFAHRPSSVNALLDDKAVALRNLSQGGKVFTYVGYVRLPAAVLRIPSFWTGVPIRNFTLRVTAHLGTAVEQRTFRVQLHAGWG